MQNSIADIRAVTASASDLHEAIQMTIDYKVVGNKPTHIDELRYLVSHFKPKVVYREVTAGSYEDGEYDAD